MIVVDKTERTTTIMDEDVPQELKVIKDEEDEILKYQDLIT